jgi:hypothetical protein
MAKTKKYLKGSAKQGQFESIGISILATELRPLVNEKGYVNFFISPKKEVGQYGDTHSIYVLEGEAEPKQAPTKTFSKPQSQAASNRIDIDDLPF